MRHVPTGVTKTWSHERILLKNAVTERNAVGFNLLLIVNLAKLNSPERKILLICNSIFMKYRGKFLNNSCEIKSTLALKPMADVTRSPKQGYQRPHEKNLTFYSDEHLLLWSVGYNIYWFTI